MLVACVEGQGRLWGSGVSGVPAASRLHKVGADEGAARELIAALS